MRSESCFLVLVNCYIHVLVRAYVNKQVLSSFLRRIFVKVINKLIRQEQARKGNTNEIKVSTPTMIVL